MPYGVPVATVAINNAKNAALLAIKILAVSDKNIMKKIVAFKKKIEKESLNKKIDL
jgi:5-(carboxyamino)imidazole ribonucleotide mutase